HEQKFSILRSTVVLGTEQDASLKVVEKIPVCQHERDDIGLLIAFLLQIDSKRVGRFAYPRADSRVNVYLPFGNSGHGRWTNARKLSQILEGLLLHNTISSYCSQ